MQDIKTTGENCTGNSKLTSEVRRMCYAISRGKNWKKPHLKQLELISNFKGSSKAKNLIQWLQSLEFVLLITFWFKVLQTINDVNVLLQASKITIDEESRLIESLENDLKRVRESWSRHQCGIKACGFFSWFK